MVVLFAIIAGAVLTAESVPPPACASSATQTMPFCNITLANEQRVHDLVSRLTLAEKIAMTNAVQAPIPRLGIPAYAWGNECLHGAVVRPGATSPPPSAGATVFPQPIGLAATFDTKLLHHIGDAVGTESRALSNYGTMLGSSPGFLDCWAPNINIFRDPRWGRGSETYGEDPTLSSRMLTGYINGLQGTATPLHHTPDVVVQRVASAGGGAGENGQVDNNNTYPEPTVSARGSASGDPTAGGTGAAIVDSHQYLKVISVCKHFAAYSLEEAAGEMRFYFNAVVGKQDLQDTYLPAFKACVDANARGVMCSYNLLNNTPMCSNREMLQGTLRDKWGFTGHVVSDCGAVENQYFPQHSSASIADASAKAITAGTDLNCGQAFSSGLPDAMADGSVSNSTLDGAIARSLLGRFQLGEFDPVEGNPFKNISIDVVGSSEHLELATQAARESIVLLKNVDSTLPLVLARQTHLKSRLATDPEGGRGTTARRSGIAVIGPQANDSLVLLGNYHGDPAFANVSTPLEAIDRYVARSQNPHVPVKYAHGCSVVGDGAWEFTDALAAAEMAETTILFLGGSAKGSNDGVVHLDTTEKEGLDRTSLSLPGLQEDLLRAIAARTSTRIVLVIVAGGPISLEWAKASPRVSAILYAWYPGQQGGTALADVLFGAYSPAGKLPVTIYHANYTSQASMTDMSMRNWPGRTHRFIQVFNDDVTPRPVVYMFGAGLSYTTFAKTVLVQQESLKLPTVTVNVLNTGTAASDHIVLLFITFEASSELLSQRGSSKDGNALGRVPNRELVNFIRLRAISVGGSTKVTFRLPASSFTLTTVGGSKRVPFGKWCVHTGSGCGSGPDGAGGEAGACATLWTLPPLHSASESERKFRVGL